MRVLIPVLYTLLLSIGISTGFLLKLDCIMQLTTSYSFYSFHHIFHEDSLNSILLYLDPDLPRFSVDESTCSLEYLLRNILSRFLHSISLGLSYSQLELS